MRSLNPYSTGSNSNYEHFATPQRYKSLNPYSTGSNSNTVLMIIAMPLHVLILILLEVTQIIKENILHLSKES